MSDQQSHDDNSGLLLEDARPKLKRPPMYKVLLHNDDFTPMDFVVEILEHFFMMNREQATQIMLQVHTKGVGVCGVFTREIAETKVALVTDYSHQHEHPLRCTMEVA